MVEKIIENVINEMAPHLDQEQLEHLSNVLYINFHGKEIREECTELTATGAAHRCDQRSPAPISKDDCNGSA